MSVSGAPNPATVVAFDFDGTLTYCDTLLPFLRHAAGRARFWIGIARLTPTLVFLKAGFVSNEVAKERVLQHFLSGWSRERLTHTAHDFAQRGLPQLIDPKALERLTAHVADGDRVVIVTASPEAVVAPWAATVGIREVVGTRLAEHNGLLTGALEGRNCHGTEKMARLTLHVGALTGVRLVAYGDSAGDRALLAAAHQGHFRAFHQPNAWWQRPWRFVRALA